MDRNRGGQIKPPTSFMPRKQDVSQAAIRKINGRAVKINKIIVHCSDSKFGNAELIDGWHKERGWKSIGYHFVICNGKIGPHYDPATIFDGWLEEGRHLDLCGAHCEGENENSIGICLIGVNDFTTAQFERLTKLTLKLMKDYHIPLENVIGHYETASGKKQGKTCPNFDMDAYRSRLKKYLEN